jgi:hypothetical protein
LIGWSFSSLYEGLAMALITVIVFSAFGLREKINPVTSLEWSWDKLLATWIIYLKKYTVYGLIVGSISGIFYYFQNIWSAMAYGIIFSIIFALFTIFFLTLVLALIFGSIATLVSQMRSVDIGSTAVPNQGIKQSGFNAIIAALVGWLVTVLSSGLVVSLLLHFPGSQEILNSSSWKDIKFVLLKPGLAGGLIVGAIPAFACIQHFTLRLILYYNSYIPWLEYARFLDYAAERIFLQKVGGGYIFIHRMLMEHFAQMEIER